MHQFVMAWFLVLQYILCPFASLVQVLGLILLYRRRKVSRNRNQRYILIGLWLTESAFGIFNIFYLFALLPRWIINILETYLSVLYYSFMILLTSDRFLVFYLNMKYPIHCTSKKLLKIFFFSGGGTSDSFFNVGPTYSVWANKAFKYGHNNAICVHFCRYFLYFYCYYHMHLYIFSVQTSEET